MGAPALQPARQPGQRSRRGESLRDLVLGAGRLPVDHDRHPQRVSRVAPDRGVDDAVGRLGVTPDDGVVAAAGGAGGELLDEGGGGRLRPGDDEQP